VPKTENPLFSTGNGLFLIELKHKNLSKRLYFNLFIPKMLPPFKEFPFQI
jgi:hypothetical protein